MGQLTYYTTAFLARELRISQVHLQRVIKNKSVEAPAARLRGIGTRPPQHCFTEQQIQRIKREWKAARR